MRLKKFLSLLWLVAAGCATAPVSDHAARPVNPFPAEAFITERAVFNARGAQFPLNGYLALSAAGGKRLVVTENFGRVVADVLVKPDGKIFVMQSSRMFPATYIRYGIAVDLECLCGDSPAADCPVKMPGPNRFVIDRGTRYRLDLQIVEIKSGTPAAELFDETKAEK
jgi:hypothetical protein